MSNIQQAIEALDQGGVVIFPTDTVYGIGCRLDNPEAIKRVYTIRNRPEEKAVLAVVSSINMAQEYLLPIPQKVNDQLITNYWPGGLTIILPCNTEKVPSIARAVGQTLAVRQTDHPVLLQLIQAIGVPLIAPSANFAGAQTPKNFTELDPNLTAMVDCVLEGACGGSVASTIVDCSVNPWKLVREGAVHISI